MCRCPQTSVARFAGNGSQLGVFRQTEALQISNPKRLLDVHFYPLRFILPDRKSFRLHAGSVGPADSRSRFVEDLESLGRQAEQPFRHFAGAVIRFQRAVQAADLLLRQGVKDKIVPFVF